MKKLSIRNIFYFFKRYTTSQKLLMVFLASFIQLGCAHFNARQDYHMNSEKKIQILNKSIFRAKVNKIIPLSQFSGKCYVTDGDPAFVIEIDSIKCIKDSCSGILNQANFFAIHSPVLLFALPPERAVGKYFNFELIESELLPKKDKIFHLNVILEM
jgi:hypothetical protein